MSTSQRKSIFISGGASGIGREVALRFHKEGWIVGVYDIDAAALEALSLDYLDIITGELDVTNYEQWEEALADFTAHTGGRLDVLDNNAGIIGDHDIVDQSPEIIKKQCDINCTGVIYGARAAHPYLSRTPGAHLVNMSSAAALYGQPHITPYSASKFFVTGFTQALDLEWRKNKIRVVALQPLWAQTALADVDAASTKRLGVRITPEQVAEVVWKAVHPANIFERQRHFYSLSGLDLTLRYLIRLVPSFVTRNVNKFVAG